MPAVSNDEAVERLTMEIEHELGPDELLEVYNELFEDDPAVSGQAHGDPSKIAEQLVLYVHGNRDPEEVVQVWNLVCPSDRHVWYDEETRLYHFSIEKPQAVD